MFVPGIGDKQIKNIKNTYDQTGRAGFEDNRMHIMTGGGDKEKRFEGVNGCGTIGLKA